MEKKIATITIKTIKLKNFLGSKDDYDLIRIFSYDTEIASLDFRNGKLSRFWFCNASLSVTSAKHQGLIYSFIERARYISYDRIFYTLQSIKTLKEWKSVFGYIPYREREKGVEICEDHIGRYSDCY